MKAPGVLASFEGITNPYGYIPPDTSGDIGPNHYVEAVNTAFAVYSRTGTVLKAPTDMKLLWSGLSAGLCKTHSDGDPIVLYDRLANRWLLSQFAIGTNDYHECIAISKTGDPMGAYWSYDFQISTTRFNDYPKFGVWPDGYYVSFNDFLGGTTFAGVSVVAFDRAKMLSGLTATGVKFSTNTSVASILPSHFESRLPPPAGAPNIFVTSVSPNALALYPFDVDFATPANSTFGPAVNLTTANFDWNLCGYFDCIPQPATPEQLDPLSDRLLQRFDYRNLGGSPNAERLVVSQTVDVGVAQAGVRWYELRRSGGSWSIANQGTYSPDATHRWMPSTAIDGSGNLAVGYSASSGTTFPSLRYTGRTPTDAANTLQAETIMQAGSGSQTHSVGRWGDYTTLSVDPVDDCTFWYVGQYYPATDVSLWHTRIGSFRFPSCVGIKSFSPTSGPVGTLVTVTGVGFGPSSAVKINGLPATTTFVNGTTLKATIPSGATNGRISVATGSNSGVSATSFVVTPSNPPTITSFSPTSGITGSSVTVNGTFLSGASAVKFNGTNSPSFTINSASKITAKVPNGAKAGPLSVTTPVATATSSTSFTPTFSVQGFSPINGPAGTTVTINGVGFTPTSVVKLNGTAMTGFVFVSANQVKANVPASATTGKITVTNTAAPVGTVTSATNFTKT